MDLLIKKNDDISRNKTAMTGILIMYIILAVAWLKEMVDVVLKANEQVNAKELLGGKNNG